MKKLMFIMIAFVVALSVQPKSVYAASVDHLLITQLQTGNEEFVEIYNPTDETVDLAEYRLEYYSATSTAYGNPFRVFTATAALHPGGRVVFASNAHPVVGAIGRFAKVLADAGGGLRLAKKDAATWQTTDAVAWGTSHLSETASHVKPGNEKSLTRRVVNGEYIDIDNNATDFELLAVPDPNTANNPPVDLPPNPVVVTPIATPDPSPVDEDTTSGSTDPATDNTSGPSSPPDATGGQGSGPVGTNVDPPLQPYITELLPNPASPATDDADEFIEIYNPNSVPFDLSGWKLQAGNNYTYDYVLNSVVVQANSYIVLYSRDTNLALSNTSSRVRLLNEQGQTINEVPQYESADEGASWQVINGVWQWGLAPTPGAINLLSAPTPITTASNIKASSAKTTKNQKPTKTSQASVSSSKSTAKTAAAKTTGANKKPATQKNTTAASSVPAKTPNAHPWLLGAASVLALSYGVYEYRFEFSRGLRRFAGNLPFGGKSR